MATTVLDAGTLGAGVALTGGGLIATYTGSGSDSGAQVAAADTLGAGKLYFESKWGADTGGDSGLGICKSASVNYPNLGASAALGAIIYRSSNLWINTVNTGTIGGTTFATNDLIAICIDLDNLLIWVKNMTQGTFWNNSATADPAKGIGGRAIPSGSYVPVVVFTNAIGGVRTMNFGGSTFTGTVPNGFQMGWPTSGTTLTVASTGAGGPSGGRTNNSSVVLGSGYGLPPVFLTDDGTKRSTMVAGFSVDQLAAGGTFVVTDTPDVATFAGNTGIAGPFVVTEAPDIFASVTANSATMNVTEHGDSWATSPGFARFELEGFTDTPDSGGFTTHGPDRILVRIQYGVSVVGAPSRLQGITDANGNVWQGESYIEAGQDTHNDNVRIEIWWAYSHKQVTGLTTSITIQPGGSSTTSAQMGFAVKGMNGNYNYPFDSSTNPNSYGGAIGGFFGADAPVKAFFPYSDGPMELASGVSPAFVSGNATGVAISGSPAVVLTSTGSGNPNNYASLDPSLSLVGGRHYFEVTFDNINGTDYGAGFGYAPLATSTLLSSGAGGFIVRGNGHLFNGADVGNLGVTPANGDVIGIWLDLDNGLAYAKDITQGGNWNGSPTVNPLRSFGGINVAPSIGSGNIVSSGLIGQNTAPALIFGAPAGSSSAKMTFNFTPTPPLGTQLINGGFTTNTSFPYPAINFMAMLSVTGSLFGILPTLSGFTADILDDGVGSQRDMASSLQHRQLFNNIPITDNVIFQDAGLAPTWAMLYDTIVPGAIDPGSLESTEAADTAHFVGFPGAFGFVGDLLATDSPDTAIILGFERDSGVLASSEATDTFSAFGFQPLTMTWHSTEAPDILTAAGIGRGENGIFVTTETTDTFTAIGHAPVSGAWASLENTDQFTALGAGVTRVRRRRSLIVA